MNDFINIDREVYIPKSEPNIKSFSKANWEYESFIEEPIFAYQTPRAKRKINIGKSETTLLLIGLVLASAGVFHLIEKNKINKTVLTSENAF